MRPLTFSDDQDNEQRWLPSDPRPVFDAFLAFVARHHAEDNTSFAIDDEDSGEGLILWLGHGFIGRVSGEPDPQVEIRGVDESDYRKLVIMFARGGCAALDRFGPWWPDMDSARRSGLRSEFDESVLRRTHPRKLRRRLAVLTRADGRQPTAIDGFTHYGFGDGAGDTVDAWFDAAGRGLVVTFDRDSDLAAETDGAAQAARYDGVPADLLASVRDAAESDPGRAVAHPEGGALLAATGIFTFTGPCAMAEGLLIRLQEQQSSVADARIGGLLERFLTLADFSPATVAEAGPWWNAEAIAAGFAALDDPPVEPLDPKQLERFCEIWADSGYNDRWDVHYVFFDGWSRDKAGEAREELLSLITALGLEGVEAPPGVADGEVWVRTDPRVDAELGNWA